MRISHNTTAPTCLGTLPNRRPTTIRSSPDWEAPSSGGNNLPSMIQTTGHLCLRERPYINIWVIERSLSEKLLVHQHDSNFLSKKSDLACCHSADIYFNTSRIQIGNVFSEDKPLHRMIVEGKNADPWKHALLGKYKMRTLKKKTQRERQNIWRRASAVQTDRWLFWVHLGAISGACLECKAFFLRTANAIFNQFLTPLGIFAWCFRGLCRLNVYRNIFKSDGTTDTLNRVESRIFNLGEFSAVFSEPLTRNSRS